MHRRGGSTGGSHGASMALVARHAAVYEPCEDSFLLADALLEDAELLAERRPALCLELGCGSGYVVTSLALILASSSSSSSSSCVFLATDINPSAAETAALTARNHAVTVDFVVTDLALALQERLAGSVDVALFNPPYVPTEEEEVGAPGIVASWAGGLRGRTVIDRALPVVERLLSPQGLFYLLVLWDNEPAEIEAIMAKAGFSCKVVLGRATEEESLCVLRFQRRHVQETQLMNNSAASQVGNDYTSSKNVAQGAQQMCTL